MSYKPLQYSCRLESLEVNPPEILFLPLKELVSRESGCLIPYQGNPWKLVKQDTTQIEEAAIHVLHNLSAYSIAARLEAINRFSAKTMAQQYLKVIYNLYYAA